MWHVGSNSKHRSIPSHKRDGRSASQSGSCEGNARTRQRCLPKVLYAKMQHIILTLHYIQHMHGCHNGTWSLSPSSCMFGGHHLQ
jgi:hypothetical protein